MAALGRAASPYGPWVVQGPVEKEGSPQPPPLAQVKLRFFCAPPAGMGAWCFHGWAKGLPEGVEVMPLELPARNTRIGEQVPYASSIGELAGNVLDGLGRDVLNARPFALFGHSFGAWLVYEMAQELERRTEDGWPHPEKVYVSACRAPQLSGIEHDADHVNPTLADLGEFDFWDAFERRYGRNPDLQSDYVRGFVRGLLQADFSLLENYSPSCSRPLSVPLCALCAVGDGRCWPDQLAAWAECCHPDSFQERWFEDGLAEGGWATEHRYIVDSPGSLLRFLHADLPLIGEMTSGYSGLNVPPAAALEAARVDEVAKAQAGQNDTGRCFLQ